LIGAVLACTLAEGAPYPDGEGVMVETDDATIPEVFQGRIRQTIHPLASNKLNPTDEVDLSACFPEYPNEPRRGLNDQVSISPALERTGTITLLEINTVDPRQRHPVRYRELPRPLDA